MLGKALEFPETSLRLDEYLVQCQKQPALLQGCLFEEFSYCVQEVLVQQKEIPMRQQEMSLALTFSLRLHL
jgi:hypothetical protein